MSAAESASPSVSVIIPCYNCARTLPSSIESVLAQEDIQAQIILIDDGSSDDTPMLIRAFHAQYPDRILFASQPSKGPAAARNLAIGMASTDYIAFLDSDDMWTPGKLREQIAYMVRHPECGLSHTDAVMVDADGRQVRLMKSREAFNGPCFEKMLESNGLITSTVCIRRDVIGKCGLFDTTLVTRSDWEYWVRVAREYAFGSLNRPLCYYRVHDSNISRRIDQSFSDHATIIHRNIERYGGEISLRDVFDKAWFLLYASYAASFAHAGRYREALRNWVRAARLQPVNLKMHYTIARACSVSLLKKLLAPVLARGR